MVAVPAAVIRSMPTISHQAGEMLRNSDATPPAAPEITIVRSRSVIKSLIRSHPVVGILGLM